MSGQCPGLYRRIGLELAGDRVPQAGSSCPLGLDGRPAPVLHRLGPSRLGSLGGLALGSLGGLKGFEAFEFDLDLVGVVDGWGTMCTGAERAE